MTDITCNHLSQTYNQVYPLGILNDISRDFSEALDKKRNLLGVAYQVLANTSSYSSLVNIFVGEYDRSITKFEQPWLTSELKEFLNKSKHLSTISIEHFLSVVYDIFGKVKIETTLYVDPEEGWIKPVFTVYSGIEDFDELLKLEDNFFLKAEKDSQLLSTLPFVVLSQA